MYIENHLKIAKENRIHSFMQVKIKYHHAVVHAFKQ